MCGCILLKSQYHRQYGLACVKILLSSRGLASLPTMFSSCGAWSLTARRRHAELAGVWWYRLLMSKDAAVTRCGHLQCIVIVVQRWQKLSASRVVASPYLLDANTAVVFVVLMARSSQPSTSRLPGKRYGPPLLHQRIDVQWPLMIPCMDTWWCGGRRLQSPPQGRSVSFVARGPASNSHKSESTAKACNWNLHSANNSCSHCSA